MKQMLKVLSKLLMVALIAAMAIGGTSSCTSKKKLAAEKEAAAYAAKVDKAKKDLNAIIDGSTTMSLDEQRRRVAQIKGYNFNDPDVNKLISLAEKEIDFKQAETDRKAEEERLRKEEEARLKAEQSKYDTYNQQFKNIAQGTSLNASNAEIALTLEKFESPDAPVLIIISEENGIKDYDKPTTAERFLNYLKDRKEYNYEVISIERNSSSGKISLLELRTK